MAEPRVIFVTDPLCSWCWGTLPHILTARATLHDEVEFHFRLSGLQVGNQGRLNESHRAALRELWQRVAETTGATFSGQLPESTGFRYHSELPCRAIHAFRQLTAIEPWDYLFDIQRALFVESEDITSTTVLTRLAVRSGADELGFRRAFAADEARTTSLAEAASPEPMTGHVLPSVLLDSNDEPPQLVAGGYVESQYLVSELRQRLNR